MVSYMCKPGRLWPSDGHPDQHKMTKMHLELSNGARLRIDFTDGYHITNAKPLWLGISVYPNGEVGWQYGTKDGG